MTLKAVIFDLDGTLLDTLDDLADAMNAVLELRDYPTHPVDDYRYFVGDGMVMLVRRALPVEWCGEKQVNECVEAFRDEYARRWDNKTRPYDGVADMLDELTGRGVPLAVLSNKPHDFTKLCVSKLLGRWRFAAVQGVTDEVPPKPDGRGAALVADTLGVAPPAVLYLGDTGTDMKTAVAAGMYAVGATWGFRGADELTHAGARVLVSHPRETPPLLQVRPA